MKTTDYLKLDLNKTQNIANSLQQLLADFQLYYTNLRGFHWLVKGPNFFALHSKFEELYDEAADNVDAIAERILQLGGQPEYKFSKYLKAAKINETDATADANAMVKATLDMLGVLVGQERELIEKASDAGDEATVALLSDLLTAQEKSIWMLSATLG